MYIQVRTIDGKKRITVSISKTATIRELKTQIQDELETPVDKQRLFFRGKQLENEHTLFDYGINLNDVVQLMIKQDDLISSKTTKSEERLQQTSVDEAENQDGDADKDDTDIIKEDEYYRVGDKVDCKGICGAWFEGEIKEIIKPTDEDQKHNEEAAQTNLYKVKFLNDEEADTVLALKNIRPRAGNLISIENIKKGDVVIANYNGDDPEQPGFWYTCVVTSVSSSTRKPKLIVTIEISREDEAKLHNCKIKFIDNVFRLEEHKLISERTENDSAFINGAEIPQRDLKAEYCNECRDNQAVESCKKCGCQKCTLKSDPNLTILCDECDNAYHIYCLNPPLECVPEDDDWYCPDCKNDENEIVKAGEKLKFSKKKSKMASKISASEGNKSRDWGKGMACVGRTKECTLVPPNHFGPIPGIEVGTTWKFRVQVSEAGVHRPHVAGIHGRESEGAYSIVLSGGYEDDVDNGESFFFTGSGGRDLSGNKRTAEQSCDQTLTRYNLALALNCNATMNTKDGATAKDWKNGKPVRVVRNFKLQKHSKYAPEEGNRYDGIYKVVKYYPEKGKSGYLVWRYLLRRDDPTPAPWTSEGKALIKAQGLDVMLVPDGYKETENGKKTPSGKKRAREGSSEPSEELVNGDKKNTPPKKKKKQSVVAAYKLPEKLKKMITKDTKNTKVWELVMSKLEKGKQEFLSEVQNSFMCICCLELINNPVTTDCSHNVCKSCLVRSFKSEVYTCAHCRYDFGKDYKIEMNDQLQNILSELFPGYNSGR